MQFGKALPANLRVKSVVMLWTVRSDSLSGSLVLFLLAVGLSPSGYQPILRGKAVVMGPMTEKGLLVRRSQISLITGLPYSGLGMVGESSQSSTGRISSSGRGVYVLPVRCGLLCLSSLIAR